MTHALKTWPEFYKHIESGSKPWELRKYDRLYSTGDKVILQEWDPVTGKYTGKECHFKIGYIYFDIHGFGIKEGYCIFTLEEILHD